MLYPSNFIVNLKTPYPAMLIFSNGAYENNNYITPQKNS